jgi:hypothetical protein
MVCDIKETTPLYQAVMFNDCKSINILLEANCDINKKCTYKKVLALELAKNLKFDKCIELIENKVKENKLLEDIKLHETKIQKMKEADNEKCPICIETIESVNDIKITDYFHIFHKKCWDTMVEHELDKNNTIQCPICRSRLLIFFILILLNIKIKIVM